MTRKTTRTLVLIAPLIVLFCTPSNAQTLLVDEFDGTGFVDQKNWRLAFGGDGSFFGRTQLKTDLAVDYPALTGSGTANLRLDTYLDNGMGGGSGVFSGHEINTKRNFARGGGLSFNVRARLNGPAGGLVGGMFLFDVTRTNGMGELVRDEIDHEMISNEVANPPQRVFTNYWNEGPFSGMGSGGTPQFDTPAGYDMTQFHDYRIDWLPNRIDWYVDGNLVRTADANIPDDPMNLRLNLWAPDAGFAEAFNPSLQPAMTAMDNVTYTMEIDSVTVDRLNTSLGPNLITTPGFENMSNYINLSNGPADETQLDTWFGFNNSFFDGQTTRNGTMALKTFGTFTNGGASGFFQNVDASEGDVFEASAFAQTITGDSIDSFPNYARIDLDFYDQNGVNLGENGKQSIILEGRDPETPIDEWVEGVVNAVAPANTDYVRMSLFFIQEGNDPGAIWFDDVSLRKLTIAQTTLEGDLNDDGVVGADDLDLVLQNWGDPGDPPPMGWVNDLPVGIIGATSLDLVLNNWGNSSNALASVPEPSTSGLCFVAALALWARRRFTGS